MENKFIVPRLEEHEDITKKQPQEDFTDLDAVCYYSNIPLSELCSPEQILTKNNLKGFPAILPASNINAAILRVVDNKIVLIDTYSKTSLRDANIAKELLQREMPSSEPAYFNVDCKRFDTENDKKVYGDYEGDIIKMKVRLPKK